MIFVQSSILVQLNFTNYLSTLNKI